jgi:hypothetical protein
VEMGSRVVTHNDALGLVDSTMAVTDYHTTLFGPFYNSITS